MMEFHISRSARNRYQFAETLFSFTGNVVFANVAASREFAYRMNLVRDAQNHPERAVNAGALYVMGLIDEASHALMARYRQQFDPNVMLDALSFFSEQVGPQELDKMLLAFVQQFPGTQRLSRRADPQGVAGRFHRWNSAPRRRHRRDDAALDGQSKRRPSVPLKNSSRTAHWRRRPPIAVSPSNSPPTLPPARWCPSKAPRRSISSTCCAPPPSPLPARLSEQLSVIRKQVEVPARRKPRALPAHRRRHPSRRGAGDLDALQSSQPRIRSCRPGRCRQGRRGSRAPPPRERARSNGPA